MDSLHHIQKFNLQRIKDLRVRGNTVKLLEDSKRVNLHDLGSGSVFLARIPKAQAAKGENR